MAAGQLIQRGDKTWLIRVFLGRVEGKRKYLNQTVHGNKKDAQRTLTKLLRERDAGVLVEPSRQTVDAFLDSWLATSVEPRVRERTFHGYSEYLRRYIRPAVGRRRVCDLTPIELRSLYVRMRAQGLSARTVQQTHAVIHAALQQAVKDRLVAVNAAHSAKDALPRRERGERRVLAPAEISKFVEAARNDRYGAYWLLLLTAGLRPGEALALRWSDLTDGKVSIQRALIERSGKLHFAEPKTSKSRRSVPLPRSALEALSQHRARQAQERLFAGPSWVENDLIFANGLGGPLRQSNLQDYFKKLLARAGLADMRIYDLRHSCATLLLSAGESPKVVAERLGHSSVGLTLDTYSHVLPDMQERATEKMETIICGR